MAIIKHVTSKNMSYSDVLDYFTYKHREDPERGSYEPVLDEYGLLQERENCAIVCLDPYGRDADPRKWSLNCLKTNGRFGKNREKTDRKQHQYILSHPEEDRPKMTMEDLLEEGKAFSRENLKGYDVLIAVHRDTDNDHIHLAINSVRAAEREPQSWMMKSDDGSIRRSEVCAGGKHQDSPEFRRHYNDWVLAYTREHGLATKDNNAMAEQHKRERYEKRNQELADAIRSAAGKCGSFREMVSTLEAEKIFLLRRGNAICALGPQNRNAVRLETLGIHPEEIPILQDGLNQSSFAPAKDFLIEKRKYMDWLEHRRQKNAKRAEDALADVAALITSLHPGKDEFRELQSLLKQTIYLERDLQTELDKVDHLLERWNQYRDASPRSAQKDAQERYLRWCGCNPDSWEERENLEQEREIIHLQIQQTESIQQALQETADQWRKCSEAIPVIEDPLDNREQLSQKLSIIRANRKKLSRIAYNCQKAANRRIYNQPYLQKAEYFRNLWYQKLQEEKAIKAKLKQLSRE